MCKYVAKFYDESTHKMKIYRCRRRVVKDGFCIFHHKDYWRKHPDRVRRAFKRLISNAIKRKRDLLCIGFNLPSIRLNIGSIDSNIYLNQSKIHGSLLIYNLKFRGVVSFKNVLIEGDVSIINANFENKVFFDECSIKGCLEIENTEFKDIFDLSHSEFSDRVVLINVSALKEIKLFESNFKGGIQLTKINTSVLDFRDAKVERAFHMSQATIGDVLFESTSFNSDKSINFVYLNLKNFKFTKARFNHDTSFFGVNVKHSTLFDGSVFNKNARFIDCNFNNVFFAKSMGIISDEDCAQFKGDTSFEYVHFKGNVYFAEVSFLGNATFEKVIFSKISCFWRTSFSKGVVFRNIEFGDIAIFDESTFLDRAVFENIELTVNNSNKDNLSFISFRRVDFKKQDSVVFDSIDFKRVSLIHTELSRVKFRNIKWPRTNEIIILFDDYLLSMDKKERENFFQEVLIKLSYADFSAYSDSFDDRFIKDLTYENIIQIYRMLRENHEFFLKYDTAGKFFVREKDIILKSKKLRSFEIAEKMVLFIYRGISLYGESIIRPISLLLLTLFTSTIIYGLYSLKAYFLSPIYLVIPYFIFVYATYFREYPAQWCIIGSALIYGILYALPLIIIGEKNVNLLNELTAALNFVLLVFFQFIAPSNEYSILRNMFIITLRVYSAMLIGLTYVSIRRKTERKYRH